MNTSHLSIPKSINHKLLTVAVVGVVVIAATALFSPMRAWANLLLASYYLITLGLGGALFVAITTVCGAGWNTAFRRVPEAMAGLLPFAGAALLVSVAIRLPEYGWHLHGGHDPGTFWFKELWLTPKLLMIRAVIYVVLWIIFAKIIVGQSRSQDVRGGEQRPLNPFASVLFIFVFGITITLAGIDWIMSLEPLWFSTMWGVYQFAGLMMGILSSMIVACILLRRVGIFEGIFRDDHLQDLGKLLMGFGCFWMYIWFSQFMLIWYSNIPEETSYFILRTNSAWGPIVVIAILLNWIIPFFTLLPRPCKRNESVMLRVAVIVLIGRWVDLYMMIFPPVTGEFPVFGLPEIASFATVASLAGLLFIKAFSAADPVPRNDPYLQESLHYHC